MKMIQGNFLGTGSDIYLCLGTIPRHIVFTNLGTAQPIRTIWSRDMMTDILTVGGINIAAAGTVTDNAYGEGVDPYYGGDVMTTTNQTDVTYGGDPVYIERDDKDYRYYTNAAAGITGDASTVDITTWQLDTAGSGTGRFNGDVAGTYIGKGSRVVIQDNNDKHRYEAYITTDLSTSGGAANEVYLNQDIPSGKVQFIGGKYSYIAVPIGNTTSAGVMLGYATTNENGMMIGFTAWCD